MYKAAIWENVIDARDSGMCVTYTMSFVLFLWPQGNRRPESLHKAVRLRKGKSSERTGLSKFKIHPNNLY